MKITRIAHILLLIVLVATSEPTLAQFATTDVYVGNQGNFSDANGSVSHYDPASGMVVADVITNLNTLVQSITIEGDSAYVMSNTSNRIDIFDTTTNTRVSQIIGVPSPRYMAVVDPTKAYVSNLFDKTITIINLIDNCPEDTISVGANPEDIAISSGRAYVANSGFGADSTVTVVDISTDTVIDTIDLDCDGPRMLEVDGQGDVWVFCNGNTIFNDDFTEVLERTNGKVVVLGGHSGAIIARFDLEAQLGAASAGQDSYYDAVTDRAFVVQGQQVLVYNTTDNSFWKTIDIPGDEQIGGVAYDAAGDRLYVSRITGFTTTGFVSVHDLDGVEIDRFDVGIAPTSIVFKQVGTSVAVEDVPETVGPAFTLHQNYPNPFSSSTSIGFEITETSPVSLDIYNLLGERVASLLNNEQRTTGSHEVRWRPDLLPNGTYFYKLTTNTSTITKQMTVLR